MIIEEQHNWFKKNYYELRRTLRQDRIYILDYNNLYDDSKKLENS